MVSFFPDNFPWNMGNVSSSSLMVLLYLSAWGPLEKVLELYLGTIIPLFLIFQFKDFLVLPVGFLPNRILSAFRMGRQALSRDPVYWCIDNKIQKTKFYFSWISSNWTLLILPSFSEKATTIIWKKKWKSPVLPWPSASYLKPSDREHFLWH